MATQKIKVAKAAILIGTYISLIMAAQTKHLLVPAYSLPQQQQDQPHPGN